LTSIQAYRNQNDQAALEFWLGLNLFYRWGLGGLLAPVNYVYHGFEKGIGLDKSSAYAFGMIHDSWVPCMAKGVFGMQEVKKEIAKFKQDIIAHYQGTIYGKYSDVNYAVILDNGPKSNLQGILGKISIGYIANREQGSNEIHITWYCYDDIDARSFGELSTIELGIPAHRLEASADLIWDKLLQTWYNFRVSMNETIIVE
jgi:hypothetical protein